MMAFGVLPSAPSWRMTAYRFMNDRKVTVPAPIGS